MVRVAYILGATHSQLEVKTSAPACATRDDVTVFDHYLNRNTTPRFEHRKSDNIKSTSKAAPV